MKRECDGFEFDFTDARDVFVFDDKDKTSPHFHGLSHAMKAVDLIVEFDDYYLFVEVKDFHAPSEYRDKEHFKHLREVLKHKYRDTWIYRWCEGKVDKPIKYLCLLELENGLLGRLVKEMRIHIPTGRSGPRWNGEISDSCMVLNYTLWNSNFRSWPVKRLASAE